MHDKPHPKEQMQYHDMSLFRRYRGMIDYLKPITGWDPPQNLHNTYGISMVMNMINPKPRKALIWRRPSPHLFLCHMVGSFPWPWSSKCSRTPKRWPWRRWRQPRRQTPPSLLFHTREGSRWRWSCTWCGKRSSPIPQTSTPPRWRRTPWWIISKAGMIKWLTEWQIPNA